MQKIKNLPFDCDGNLIDSEVLAMPVASRYLVHVAEGQGVKISEDYVNGLFGKTLQDMIVLLSKDYGVTFKANVRDEIHQETVRVLSLHTKPVNGSPEFLEAVCSHDIKPYIVTSSEMDRVIAGLKCSGIKEFFPNNSIFSATTTLIPAQPKPAPEIYNYFCSVTGTRPQDTYTTEDSTSGTGSAVGARIPCFGNLAGSHLDGKRPAHAQSLMKAGAAAVFQDWRQLIEYLPYRPSSIKLEMAYKKAL